MSDPIAAAESLQQAMQVARCNERNDVLAYLSQRLRGAQAVALHNPGEADRANEIARSLTVQIEYIGQGLHEGAELAAEHINAGADNGQN